MENQDLVYTNQQISEILAIINLLQISGIDNINYLSNIIYILKHPIDAKPVTPQPTVTEEVENK